MKVEREGVLKGVRVLAFTRAAAGPVTVNYLADHGATAVKVESHTRPDETRSVGPFKDNKNPTLDTSGYFTHQNSSVYGISLDPAKPRGREVALRLVKWADIVCENTVPGVMKRRGLDYESVCKEKPDIIYLSTTMHGQQGPRFLAPGYGYHGSSFSGVFNLGGWPDRGPAPPYGPYCDYIAPPFGALAILAALEYRRRTGRGQYIDLSQVETAIHFISPVIMDYTVNGHIMGRSGNRVSSAAPHGAFPCKGDERWVAIAVSTEEQWKALARVMGEPAWTKSDQFATFLGRKENEDELERLVAGWTIDYTAEEAMTLLQAAGVPASVVESTKDLFEDPQLKYRQHFRWLEHPVMGPIAHDAPSFRLSKAPFEQFAGATIGQHNEFVYKQLLGMSDDEIADLYAERVITTEADLPPTL